MATNNFKPFATAANANVMSQTDWEALPALLSGFISGPAKSAQVNKAIRQASFIAAALAQYTANKSGLDVLDDGDLNGFISKMGTAFGKDFQALDATLTALAGLATGANKLPYFTGNDTAAQTDLTSVGRDIIGKNTIADILTYLGLGGLAKQNADNVNITGGSIRTTAGSLYDGSNRVYSDANPGATFSSDGVGLWFNVKDMLQVRIGTWSLPAEAGTSTQVAFVQAFTHKCLIAVPIPDISASDQIGTLGMTPTSVTISKGNGDASPRTGKFIAFGY
ncbi:phage tail protein [Citrobacter sp. RHB35-C21]|uniref:phage tail protein n=1 Tax=Citrobacter sp. RHB35-C21 TaxID=2742626 RepID=UPI002018286B|nr:phage tail protein [Citrobacter sp. RHB35-C21]